eukprot:gene28497-34405_t
MFSPNSKPLHATGTWSSRRQVSICYAKQKKSLVSDEVLALIEAQEKAFAANDAEREKNKKKKGNQKDKKASSGSETGDPELSIADMDVDEEEINPYKAAKKDKKKKALLDLPTEAVAATEAPADSERKTKLSSKVRLTTSSQPDFVRIALQQVEVVYGDETILKNVSFAIEPSSGYIEKSSSSLRLAYLRQDFIDTLNSSLSLREELLTAFEEENAILRKIAEVENRWLVAGGWWLVAGGWIAEVAFDAEQLELALNDLSLWQEKGRLRGVYNLQPKIQSALVGSFSGGWKMRIGLAKILATDPNIVLLDEPTNHMDLDSTVWLESFLRTLPLPLLICTKIVELEGVSAGGLAGYGGTGGAVTYDNGGYSKYVQRRAERMALWRDTYDKQQRHVKKYRAAPDFLPPPPKDRKFRFRFPAPPARGGERVVEVRGVEHGFGAGRYATLFSGVDFDVMRGERV